MQKKSQWLFIIVGKSTNGYFWLRTTPKRKAHFMGAMKWALKYKKLKSNITSVLMAFEAI